ncbi:hypothetical protein KCU62_g342, partial [Aureobasidium sp. EXF-3399]
MLRNSGLRFAALEACGYEPVVGVMRAGMVFETSVMGLNSRVWYTDSLDLRWRGYSSVDHKDICRVRSRPSRATRASTYD